MNSSTLDLFMDLMGGITSDSSRMEVVRSTQLELRVENAQELIAMSNMFFTDVWKCELWKHMQVFPSDWMQALHVFYVDTWRHAAVVHAMKHRPVPVSNWVRLIQSIFTDTWKHALLQTMLQQQPPVRPTAQELEQLLQQFEADAWKVRACTTCVSCIAEWSDDQKQDTLARVSNTRTFENQARQAWGLAPLPLDAGNAGPAVCGGGEYNFMRGMSVISQRHYDPQHLFPVIIDAAGKVSLGRFNYMPSSTLIFNQVHFQQLANGRVRMTPRDGLGDAIDLGPGTYWLRNFDGVLLDEQHQVVVAVPKVGAAVAVADMFQDVTQVQAEIEQAEWKDKDIPDLLACVACMGRPRGGCMLLPCKHTQLCKLCSLRAKEHNACFVCRSEIQRAVQIY